MTRNIATFARLYQGELDGLVRFAYAVSGDRSAAEDIAAEAVTRVWARWRKDDIDDLGAYLRRAVVNEVISRSRRRQHRQRREPFLAAGATTPSGETDEATVDDRDALWTALRALPVEQRAVVTLRYLSDLTEVETAAALAIPLGTVKSRASRGLEQLRAHLSEVDHDA